MIFVPSNEIWWILSLPPSALIHVVMGEILLRSARVTSGEVLHNSKRFFQGHCPYSQYWAISS
jgi:hypothetical protein